MINLREPDPNRTYAFRPGVRDSMFMALALGVGRLANNTILEQTPTWQQEFALVEDLPLEGVNAKWLVGVLSTLPVMMTPLAELTQLLGERESNLETLLFIAGCSQAMYVGVSVLVMFVTALVPYVVMLVVMTQGLWLRDVSLSLLMTVCVEYIAAEIAFHLFLSAFVSTSAGAHRMTIALLVCVPVIAVFDTELVLQELFSSNAIKHVLSIAPFSAWMMSMMSIYENVRYTNPATTWSRMDSGLSVGTKQTMMWLAIDFAVYGGVYVLMNVEWKRLIKCEGSSKPSFAGPRLLSVTGLRKIYHGLHDTLALDNVDFEIMKGEVVIVVGLNGAGKSSMLNCLSGIIQPTAGELVIGDATPTRDFRSIWPILGLCPQENVLVPELTPEEHFLLFGAIRGIPLDETLVSLERASDQLQLRSTLKSSARKLSGGQKRKLCVALALLGGPRLAVLDEPTAGLDVQSRQQVWRMVSELPGTATIATTHAVDEAEVLDTRLFVVAGGKLKYKGTCAELRSEGHCGYRIRVEGDEASLDRCLDLARFHIPEAKLSTEPGTILLPVTRRMPQLVHDLENGRDELGFASFSIVLDRLEDIVLRWIHVDGLAEVGPTLGSVDESTDAPSNRDGDRPPPTRTFPWSRSSRGVASPLIFEPLL